MHNSLASPPPSAAQNTCKVCAPLGAAMAFCGLSGCIPLLHGSQGCATYIRRYLISHFREPVDIASSSFSEEETIFGGGQALKTALANVVSQYQPEAVGIATTCLAETIGEDVPALLRQMARSNEIDPATALLSVSTPSYQGSHYEGFHAAVRAMIASLAVQGPLTPLVAVFPGMVSPADIRHLKEILSDFELPSVLAPDYSDTLDGPAWPEYQRLQPGGVKIEQLRALGSARACLQLGRNLASSKSTAAAHLQQTFGMECHLLGWPIGIRETDRFFHVLQTLSGRPIPPRHDAERGRLVDAYMDGHKYLAGKRAVIFGDPDLVTGIASFLGEVGVSPVLCATGATPGVLASCLRETVAGWRDGARVLEGADYTAMAAEARELQPDFLIGNSKGASLARELKIPLIRTGFPIHDRMGGQRLLHLGYRGAQQLFDRIVNALLEHRQDNSETGYSYL